LSKKQENKSLKLDKEKQEVFNYILDELKTTTRHVRQICREDKGMPTYQTFYNWLNNHPELFDLYNNARKMQTHIFIDETLEIIDDCTNDVLEGESKFGGLIKTSNTAAVARAELRVKYRHKMAALLNAKGYGPSSTINIKNLDAKNVTESVQKVLSSLGSGSITVDEATKAMSAISAGAEAIYKHETSDALAQLKEENE
tara:strand:- start:18213 stop:18812 length:600 start_codon:yes stop_codon:yes gene_type:complete